MTNEEIIQRGILIRDETEPAQNTSTRVGGVIEGIGRNLADKDTAIAAEAARNGYYQCTVSGTELDVTAPGFTLPAHGGNIRIKMSAPATGACTLNINSTGPKTLLYNGAAVSSANTWEKDEIISVFYDPSGSGQYLASNSQGGGGNASKIKYDNSQSGLASDNVQRAVDEVNAALNATEESILGKENINYNVVTPTMKAIGTTDGQLVWKNPTSFYCYVLPFSSQKYKKVKITANANYVANIAFLVADGDVGSPVSFAGTAGVKIIPVNEEAMYTVPNGTNYLYVLYSQGAGKICFPVESLAYYEKDYITDEDLDFHLDGSEYPFDIRDENGKKIVIFENGHVRTKKFNSAQGRGDYSASTVRFTVPVNVNILKDTADSASVQDSKASTYYDNGILMLPESYTPDGKPTRLVIHCHGAGGGASDHDSQTESLTSAKYLVANGYAVMDMNGMPADWVETWDDDFTPADKRQYIKVNNLGCPLAMECYIKGYQWVVEHYNIARDGVMIEGGSMGGLSSTNLVLSHRIPVLAHALAAPVLDLYNQAFVHPWTNGASKFAMGNLYDFEKDGNGYYLYDVSKVKGYNPIVNGMQTYVGGVRRSSEGSYDFTNGTLDGDSITEYKSYPCPLKIWHCDNDPTVNISVSVRQINAIKNAGGAAWLRRFPSGGHAPDTAGNVVSNPSGSLSYKGTTLTNIYPFAEEMLLFFNRFNNE